MNKFISYLTAEDIQNHADVMIKLNPDSANTVFYSPSAVSSKRISTGLYRTAVPLLTIAAAYAFNEPQLKALAAIAGTYLSAKSYFQFRKNESRTDLMRVVSDACTQLGNILTDVKTLKHTLEERARI